MNEMTKAISKIRYAQLDLEQEKWVNCRYEIDELIIDLKLGVLDMLQDELLEKLFEVRKIVNNINLVVV